MRGKGKAMAGVWMGMLLAACCMTGCSSGESEENDLGSVRREEKADYDLAGEQWTEAGKVEDGQEVWSLTEYREDLVQEEPDKEMIRGAFMSAADGSDYYILENYFKRGQTGSGIRKFYLIHVDMETLESSRAQLILSGGSEEGDGELAAELAADLDQGWADITGMDVQDGKVCLLVRQIDRESREASHCYVLWLDQQQKAESIVDLLPEMDEAGMCRDGMVPEGLMCDREGRYYIGTGEYGIFDETGKFLKMTEVPGGGGNGIFSTCRLPDGRPVFESVSMEDWQTTIFCLEGLQEKILYRGKCASAQTRYLNEKGEIYYVGNGGLLRWDGSTGKCERIYRDSSLNPLACQAILEMPDDTIVMAFSDDNDAPFLLRIGLNAEAEEREVTIYGIFGGSEIAKYADEYSRKHPGIKIRLVTVKEAEDDKGMALNRLLARMTAGEKPDMFLVQSEELAILQDKGMLAELQERLPEELLEQIFPGVLQSGTMEDKLYGITNEAYIDTVVVMKSVWPGDSWSFRDVMALAEEKDSLSCVFGGETPDELLYHMVLQDITAGNSSLADRETKECRFDSEEFIKILEFCKEYGFDPDSGKSSSSEDIIEGMRRGEILAYRIGGDLKDFSAAMAALGEDFHCVGFPTEGSQGGLVRCYHHIAVNAGGEHQEEAVDFLQYLLSERIQRNMGIRTVRKDVLVNNVKDGNPEADIWGGREPVFQTMGRAVIPLEGKPDGSSFMQEYLEVMEKSTPMSSWMDSLSMMIIEEAAAYFSGDKTAEEVADIIQSRAWLYLNE